MLPNDPAKVREALLRWTNNDVQAADFLLQIAEIARLADDIVDNEADRQRNVCWLLSRTMTLLPMNPFFGRNVVALGPLLNTIVVNWHQSDVMRKSGDKLTQTFGFVMRESVGMLVTAVASIIGGHEHAMKVSAEYFELCHAGSTETVEDWVRGDAPIVQQPESNTEDQN